MLTAEGPRFPDSPNEVLISASPNAVIALLGAASVDPGPGDSDWYAGILGRARARLLPGCGQSFTLSRDDGLHRTGNAVLAAQGHTHAYGVRSGAERLRKTRAINRAHRNEDGGYWVAETTAKARLRACSPSWSRGQARTLALAASNIAGVTIPPPAIGGWAQLIAVLHHDADAVPGTVHQTKTVDPQASPGPRFNIHDGRALAIADFTVPAGAAS